eukprot:g5099.t1
MPFLILCVFLGMVLNSHVVRKKTHMPYTVLLLLAGGLLGLLDLPQAATTTGTWQITRSMGVWKEMDPHLLMVVFLPALIFESAFSTDTHVFRRCLLQILTLAVPGVMIASALTGLIPYYVFGMEWDMSQSVMFGAILSATDPVAVVALLKELGASEELATTIEGESLLNDGTAVVLFTILVKNLVRTYESQPPLGGGDVVALAARLSLLAPVLGLAFAWVAVRYLQHAVFNDKLTEISIGIVAGYGTFLLGEGILLSDHTPLCSGILCVVFAGLYLSHHKAKFSPVVVEFMHEFWELLGHYMNTVLFILSGVIITDKMTHKQDLIRPLDYAYLIALYALLHVVRFLTVLVCSPMLRFAGYRLTWKEMAVIVYGGLRGAVGLALALIVENDRSLVPTTVNDTSFEGCYLTSSNGTQTLLDEETCVARLRFGAQVVFYVAGIALLTLLLNGTSCGMLLHTLHMDNKSPESQKMFTKAVR